MSDPTQIGVRVWRNEANGAFCNVQLHRTHKPYLAIPLDAATLAELRERVAEMANEFGSLAADAAIGNGKHWPDTAMFADAVLAALGLEAAIAP